MGGSQKYKCLRLLTVDMGGWVENIQVLKDAFTVEEDGVFEWILTKSSTISIQCRKT